MKKNQQTFGLPTPKTSPKTAEAFLQNRSVLFLPTEPTAGFGTKGPVGFPLPSWCRCEVNASRVRFNGPGIDEVIDMANHEALAARRFVAWEVRFRSRSSTQFRHPIGATPWARRWPRPRPVIAGSDPRLLLGLVVLAVLLGPVVALPWIRFVVPIPVVALIAYIRKSRQSATRLATALNALSTQHWTPKSHSSG